MSSACDVVTDCLSAVGERVSFLDTDDPFNLRSKSTVGCYRDDIPIPATKAAILAQQQQQHTDTATRDERRAVEPLMHRDDNSFIGPFHSSQSTDDGTAPMLVGSSRDKENAVHSTLTATQSTNTQRSKAKLALQRNVKSTPRAGKDKPSTAASSPSSTSAAVDAGASVGSAAVQQLPHLRPLLTDGELSGLSSSVWMECVASVGRVREVAERYGGDDRADKLRAAVVLLCDWPGLAGSNQAVWKAVSEACHALLQAAPFTLPSSFVRLLVPSLSSKVADKRTAGPATLLLLDLAEASSARVVQRCVAACVDQHCKNLRLVEHAILFLSSLTSAFSVSAVSLPALLALCKSHSDHSQPSVRAAVTALLSTVYEQLGPSFCAPLLSSVAPSLHESVKAAMESVDAERANRQLSHTPALRRGRGEDSALVPVSLDALFPRVELSSALGSEVMSGLRDKQWQARQRAIHQLTATLEQLQHRVTMKDGSALIAGLAPLLSDSNKLLTAQAMAAVRQLICDVGEGMARWRDKLIPSVLLAVVDAKKSVREQAVAVLREWMGRIGVASVIRLVAKAMEGANSSGRAELHELLLTHSTAEAEWSELIAVTLECLCDKSGEVRAAADRLTESVIAHCGYSAVNAALHRMKEAYILQVQPSIDRHRHAKKDKAAEEANPTNHRTVSSGHSPHTTGDKQQHTSHSHKQQHGSGADNEQHCSVQPKSGSHMAEEESEKARKANSGKRKPTQHTTNSHRTDQQQHNQGEQESGSVNVRQAVAVAVAAGSEWSDADCHPFLGRVDIAGKQKRLLRDSKRLQSGTFREWSGEEREDTAHTLSTLVSPALHSSMLSADFTRQLHAVHFFTEQLSLQPIALHAIADVLLKWLSALMGEASPKLLMAVLAFLSSLFASYHSHHILFSDAEMNNVLPCLVERLMGHNVQRVRKDATTLVLTLAHCRLHSRAKLISAVMQGVDSKNKRVVAESCECVGQLWSGSTGGSSDIQLSVWNEMKAGLPHLALLLSSACDPAVRMAALSAIVSAYSAIGEQLWVVLSGHTGKPVSEKALSMIEERVKRTRMDSTALPSHTYAAVNDTECAVLPSPAAALTLTPVKKRRTAVQHTPVSSAGRHSTTRKQSNAPTLSALNSSLASLEAMHTTLATLQPTDTVPPSPALSHTRSAAAILDLPSILLRMGSGGEAEQITALLSLSAAIDQPQVCDKLVEHGQSVMAAVARTLRIRAMTVSDRRAILGLSRVICSHRVCMESVRADLSSDICHALLASIAAEMQSGGAVDASRADANYCVQALLECRGTMDQLSLLASILLSALIASSSSYLCSLLTPFLFRWAAVQRLHCEAAAVDVSGLLSWLHRLLTAMRTCESCERCVVECVDQLLLAAYECAGSEQRLLALVSGYPTDSPLIARITALCQQSTERREGHTVSTSPTTRVQQLVQLDEAVTVEETAAATFHSPSASVRLDQLLLAQQPPVHDNISHVSEATHSPSPAVGLSYVARFHALQERLRQHASLSSPAAIHHTTEFLPSHPVHTTIAQPASPPRRNTTGMRGGDNNNNNSSSNSSATSSVSAIMRDGTQHATTTLEQSVLASASASASASSAAINRSAAFEAMKQRMRAKHDDTDGGALSTYHTHTLDGSHVSLSTLLAQSNSPIAPSTHTSLPSSAPPTPSAARVCVVPGSSTPSHSVSSSNSSSSSAVSALRARLAAIHSANRTAAALTT